MRHLIITALLLTASTASAQDLWRMNSAYQNQINRAQRSAYGYGYGGGYSYGYRAYRPAPVYAPRFRDDGMSAFNAQQSLFQQRQQTFEMQNQTEELRNISRSIENAAWQRRMESLER
jgi:hypothetical protein